MTTSTPSELQDALYRYCAEGNLLGQLTTLADILQTWHALDGSSLSTISYDTLQLTALGWAVAGKAACTEDTHATLRTRFEAIQDQCLQALVKVCQQRLQAVGGEACPAVNIALLYDTAAQNLTQLSAARASLTHWVDTARLLVESARLQHTSKVQHQFTGELQAIIERMTHRAFDCLGPAPGAWALLTFGSLARGEGCPYSDFEYLLCLEHSTELMRHYGYALTLLLEAQLILLGGSSEFWLTQPLDFKTQAITLPATLALARTKGFSLDYDGDMYPRKANNILYENPLTLIGTPERLAMNMEATFTLDNRRKAQGDADYYNILCDSGDDVALYALQEAQFFLGEPSLFKRYQAAVHQRLHTPNPSTQQLKQTHIGWFYLNRFVHHFIKDEKTPHGGENEVKDQDKTILPFSQDHGFLNIKEHFLRLPVFAIRCLSLLFDIPASSTQARLVALEQAGHITPSLSKALSMLLELGFYWRIKIHLHYGKECDEIYTEVQAPAGAFTLSPEELDTFVPLYENIMRVLQRQTQAFLTQRTTESHVFQTLTVDKVDTLYQNLGAEHFHQGRWPLALAYYQQALQLTQDEALAQKLHDWITNTKTLLEDHHSTVKAVLSALEKGHVSLEKSQQQPTFTAPPESLWPESTVCQDQPYPDGLHGLHPHTLAWLRLGVSHLLTLEDNLTAWQAFHTLRFALPSPPAVYALTDELTLWQQQATAQPSSIPQTHTARLQQSSIAQTYTARVQHLMAWQDAWPQPKGFRATLKDAWQDSWNTLEAMTEAFDSTQPKDALKKGRILLLQWIKPNPLNPAEIGNLKTARLLKPELAQQLIDKHGHLLKKPLAAGQRLTYPLTLEGDTTPSFYAKVYPEFPGMQIAVDTLCALLSGASGNAILAHLYLPQKKGPLKKSRHFKPYPLLLSKSLGDTLQKSFASNTDLHSLDTYSFTWKLIETLLIHPEDDKPDNIALQSFTTPLGEPAYRLVSFDADHAFTEAVLEKKHPMRLSQELLVQLKSIVLCLNTMNHPLNPDAIAEFLSLDAASVLEQWLNHCHQFNHQLFKPEGLFSPDIMKTFYEHTSSPAFLPIAFVEGMIADLYQRWHRLRLALASQCFDSHHELLAFVNPYLARFYHDAFTQHDTPDKRFHALPTDYKTIHDKTHDTLLYVTDTGVHQGTLRSLTVAYQKKDIKKDLKTVIEQALKGHDTLFQPKHALNELKTTLAHYQQLDQIQQDLRAGDFQRFAELKIHTLKQKLFNGLVWTHYSEAQQRTLLKAAEGTQFTKLKLINCSALTLDKLAKLLKKSHDLVRLEIVNNTHVDNNLGDILAKHNPALQRLYLRRLPKLTQLLTADVNATPAPYTQLTALVAEHCNIGATGATQIVKHLPYLKQLTYLDLRDNRIPDTPIIALLDSVNTHLRELTFQLTLTGNEDTIKDDFLRELIAFFSGTKTELRCKEQLTSWDEKQDWWVLDNKKFQLLIHSLWLMPQLQSLDLAWNKISDTGMQALATHLKNCPNLQSLNFKYNDLGDAGMKALAPNLKNCPQLQSLNLDLKNLSVSTIRFLAKHINTILTIKKFNQYQKEMFDILMGRCTNTIDIDLSGNLDVLGANLLALNVKHYPQLRSLNLGNNNLGYTGLKALVPHLKDCPKLQSLDLGSNNLGYNGFKALVLHLRACPNLQSLNLGNNNLGDKGLKALVPHLKDCPKLQSLDLGSNNLGYNGFKALVLHLRACPNLQSLNFGNNNLGDNGLKTFAPHLKDFPNLQSLDLGSNNLGDAGIRSLTPYLKDCPQLQSLNLWCNKIGEAGMQALALYLKDCPQLQSLNLGLNNLDDARMQALAPYLKDCPQLQSLNLWCNKMGEAGMQVLAPYLKDCPQLQSLNIGSNNLGDAGMQALAPYFKDCPNLQSLDLGSNNLGDAGIQALAPYLKDCPNLQSLDLGSNNLGDAGMQVLAPYLKDCPNLRSLDLGFNRLSNTGMKALASYLKNCQHLHSLYLRSNNLSEADIKAFIPHLKNSSLFQLNYNRHQVSYKTQGEVSTILTTNRKRIQVKETTSVKITPTTISPIPTTALSSVAVPTTPSTLPILKSADKPPSDTSHIPSKDKNNSTTATTLNIPTPSQLKAPQAIPSHRHSWTNERPSSFSDTTSSEPKGLTP